MSDEKFFAFIVACIGFLLGVIALGIVAEAVDGDAATPLRLVGVAVGLLIGVTLWRRAAR